MAEHGYYLDNYPNGVCLPGSSMSGDGMTRALRYIPTSQFHILIKAMKAADQDRRCGFKAYKSRTSQDIKGMSISPGLQYARSLLPDAALLESRAPIVVFAPPSGASESERTGYFLDGTIRSTTQSTNTTLPDVQGEKYNTHESGSPTSSEMPAAAVMLRGSGQQHVARGMECDLSAHHGEINQSRLCSSPPMFVDEMIQQDNSGEADNREASTITRRRIDHSVERDIHHLPLPNLCPVYNTQSIIIPLQLSLGYPLIVSSFCSPDAA